MPNTTENISAYLLLCQQCNKHRNRQLRLGIVLLLVGILCGIAADTWLSDEKATAAKVACGAVAAVGLYAFIYAYRSLNPAKLLILRTLQNKPKDIVWSHQYILQNMPFGIEVFKVCDVYLYTRHGHRDCIRVKMEQLKEIQEALEKDLPHATFGYSVEREQLFRANPDMLYRD